MVLKKKEEGGREEGSPGGHIPQIPQMSNGEALM